MVPDGPSKQKVNHTQNKRTNKQCTIYQPRYSVKVTAYEI